MWTTEHKRCSGFRLGFAIHMPNLQLGTNISVGEQAPLPHSLLLAPALRKYLGREWWNSSIDSHMLQYATGSRRSRPSALRRVHGWAQPSGGEWRPHPTPVRRRLPSLHQYAARRCFSDDWPILPLSRRRRSLAEPCSCDWTQPIHKSCGWAPSINCLRSMFKPSSPVSICQNRRLSGRSWSGDRDKIKCVSRLYKMIKVLSNGNL